MRRLKAGECLIAKSVERFEYHDSPGARFVPSWGGWEETADDTEGAEGTLRRAHEASKEQPVAAELERRLHEERCRGFESGRARGVEEGRRAERELQAEALQEEARKNVRHVTRWLEQFGLEQKRYFQTVEREVVRLAWAVAARILRREAVSDPLLLMGAVRAALGQISGASQVRLRVPAAEFEMWQEAIALLPNLEVKPMVMAGEGMLLGDCAMEAELGTADLNVSSQLAEIERVLLGSGAAYEARGKEENALVSTESVA